MQRTKLPIDTITISDRLRKDLGDVDDLAASLKRYGLIQPIVINQDKRLIAGGRRIAAARSLGWIDIDCVYRETMSADELHELELEENVRRLDQPWQERCLAIKTIHNLKVKRYAMEGRSWGQRETAELMGLKAACSVNYNLLVAELLAEGNKDAWACQSMMEAYRMVVLRREEERILASLAGESNSLLERPSLTLGFALGEPEGDGGSKASNESESPISQAAEKDAELARYLENPLNDPTKFDEYYEAHLRLRSSLEQHQRTIRLCNMLFRCDCIDFMQANADQFDHIVTDIPYAVDMDMLNQQHPDGGMLDISTVEAEHDVEENMELYRRFFPAAFATMRDKGFLVTWCDQMQWQYMYDLATEAGFKVQRWPITWVKTHPCMNQMASVNFTKTTEIAMVCRKGIATLSDTNIPCHIVASHDEFKEQLGHPFVKPFIVWQHIIEAVSLRGQIVLEPFAGRGSGVISMLRLGRRVLACEINEKHYNALLENVKQHYLSISPNFLFA